MGGKFLIGMSDISKLPREVTTISSLPSAAPAAVILRMVVATPLTSSSVSVNQARLRFCKAIGTASVNSLKIDRNHFLEYKRAAFRLDASVQLRGESRLYLRPCKIT